MRSLTLASLLGLALAASASAASTLAGNLGNTPSTGTTLSASMETLMGPPPIFTFTFVMTGSAAATSFTTSSVPFTLDSVTMPLMSVPASGSVYVSIYSDNGAGAPGVSFSSLNAPGTLTTGENTFTSSAGGTLLEADTTYWLLVTYQNSGPVQSFTLGDTADLTETSDAGWTIGTLLTQSNSGPLTNTWTANDGKALAFSLNTNSTIPEPASAGLLLLSGGLLLRRQRRAA